MGQDLGKLVTITNMQCGAPQLKSWFISPSNYSYLRTINHSEIGVINQLNAILGAPPCVASMSSIKYFLVLSYPCLPSWGHMAASKPQRDSDVSYKRVSRTNPAWQLL